MKIYFLFIVLAERWFQKRPCRHQALCLVCVTLRVVLVTGTGCFVAASTVRRHNYMGWWWAGKTVSLEIPLIFTFVYASLPLLSLSVYHTHTHNHPPTHTHGRKIGFQHITSSPPNLRQLFAQAYLQCWVFFTFVPIFFIFIHISLVCPIARCKSHLWLYALTSIKAMCTCGVIPGDRHLTCEN